MSYILVVGQFVQRRAAGVCDGELERARDLYRQFHTFPCSKVVRTRLSRTIPEVLVRLGDLRGLIYSSDRGSRGRKRTFIHFMRHPPLLASNSAGTQLYILGGNYRVTNRGIEG